MGPDGARGALGLGREDATGEVSGLWCRLRLRVGVQLVLELGWGSSIVRVRAQGQGGGVRSAETNPTLDLCLDYGCPPHPSPSLAAGSLVGRCHRAGQGNGAG